LPVDEEAAEDDAVEEDSPVAASAPTPLDPNEKTADFGRMESGNDGRRAAVVTGCGEVWSAGCPVRRVPARYRVTTVPRTNLTNAVGRLSDQDLIRLNRALLVFLGLAV
jgi:hypothetical protein